MKDTIMNRNSTICVVRKTKDTIMNRNSTICVVRKTQIIWYEAKNCR